MTLEFTAARAMYAPPEGNAAALRALAGRAQQPEVIVETLRTADAEDWVLRGEAGLKAEAFGMAHESFRRASSIDGGTFESTRGGVTSAAAAGRLTEETEWLRQRVSASPHDAPGLTALSYALALTGEMKSAVNAALEAASIAPDSPQPLEQLASVLADLGEPRLASVAETLMRRFPMREDSRFYQATALFLENRHDEAERALALLIDAHPRHARALNMRGIICASRKDHACAIAAFEESLRQDPRDSAVYVNLGNVHLERGEMETAAELFRDAVALDPGAGAARTALRTMSR
jgi:cytochrome c-type biogenesis protein CcmH/NrfG